MSSKPNKSKLTSLDKEKIIEKFVITIGNYAYSNLKIHKKKFIRRCFSKLIHNSKDLHLIYNNLKHNYDFHGETNVYLELDMGKDDCDYYHTINIFAQKISKVVSNACLKQMKDITNHSSVFFDKFAKPYIKKYNHKYNRIAGTTWLVAILILSLIIPNHAINLTGITLSNAFLYAGHFLVLQFENLINPALIGRLLINVVADTPIIHHYFITKN